MTRWLLLAYQLPSRPSHVRVKTWRRLQQIGAISCRNSVYVLPNTEQCREDFEWVRSEIVAQGGDATVFAADTVGPTGADDELITSFQQERAGDYAALKSELERAIAKRKAATERPWLRQRQTVRRAHARLAELDRIDFFGAPAREPVLRALAAVEHQMALRPQRGLTKHQWPAPLDPSEFKDRRWVTRPRPGVDRMASAWLIRRFIDPRAAFAFVETASAADVPFDMYSGAFSHQGPLCTFETLVKRFEISDPVVARIGRIVHDLDMNDHKYAPAEAPALARLVEGLRQLHADDHVLLEQGMTMFEALARSFGGSNQANTRSARAVSGRRRPHLKKRTTRKR